MALLKPLKVKKVQESSISSSKMCVGRRKRARHFILPRVVCLARFTVENFSAFFPRIKRTLQTSGDACVRKILILFYLLLLQGEPSESFQICRCILTLWHYQKQPADSKSPKFIPHHAVEHVKNLSNTKIQQ